MIELVWDGQGRDRVIRAWYWIKSWGWWLSYTVRPYDMLADQRHWFWQAKTHPPLQERER